MKELSDYTFFKWEGREHYKRHPFCPGCYPDEPDNCPEIQCHPAAMIHFGIDGQKCEDCGSEFEFGE